MNSGSRASQLSGPAALKGAQDFAPSSDLVAELFVATVGGSTTSARRLLNDVWPATLRRVLEAAGQDQLFDVDRGPLLQALRGLPVLATVYDDPGRGLAEWAIVAMREAMGQPLSYPRKRPVNEDAMLEFERALLRVQSDGAGDVAQVKRVLGLGNAEVGQLLGVSGSAVSAWDRGESAPRRRVALRLRELVELAAAMEDNVKPERTPALFSSNPVPVLGGRTYQQALVEGESAAFLADLVRTAAGLRPHTSRGWALELGTSEEEAAHRAGDDDARSVGTELTGQGGALDVVHVGGWSGTAFSAPVVAAAAAVSMPSTRKETRVLESRRILREL